MKTFKLGLLLLAVSLTGCHKRLIGVTRDVKTGPMVFIMAGQSNMVGNNVGISPYSPHNGVMMYTWDRNIRPAQDPMYNTTITGQGIGPGLAFGNAVFQATGRQVILVNCGYNGTLIAQWQPTVEPYGRCVDYATDAIQRTGGTLEGIMFYQGESDAYVNYQTSNWCQQFTQMVQYFRGQFGFVPVIYAQIASTTRNDFGAAWQSIKDQQAACRYDHTWMIKTDDSALYDQVHIDADSADRVGKRFAQNYLGLAYEQD